MEGFPKDKLKQGMINELQSLLDPGVIRLATPEQVQGHKVIKHTVGAQDEGDSSQEPTCGQGLQ